MLIMEVKLKTYIVKSALFVILTGCIFVGRQYWIISSYSPKTIALFYRKGYHQHPTVTYVKTLAGAQHGVSVPARLYHSYHEALKTTADERNLVVLVPMDSGVVDMALNLFYTSLKPLGIHNHLFLSTDAEGCARSMSQGVLGCHVYASDADAADSSAFGSSAWRRKVNYKNDMIRHALDLHFNVLLVDVDIVFLKNPLRHVINACMDHATDHAAAQWDRVTQKRDRVTENMDHVPGELDHVSGNGTTCDIAAQWDGYGYNTGFLLVNSNPRTRQFYAAIRHTLRTYPQLTDQQAFNRALDMSRVPVTVKCLRVDFFMHGFSFFTAGKRHFADDTPCLRCILVHNNYIVGMAHKRYRFQELLLWWNDENQYYSSTTTQYLAFNIPPGESKGNQEKLLHKALVLASSTNRTLILPKFYEGNHQTSLSHITDVNAFSKKHNFRESVFLRHPLVPDSVKKSVLKMDTITSRQNPLTPVVHVTI
jgi:hypothetical protein